MRFLTFICVAGVAHAFQLPFWIPFAHSHDAQEHLSLPSSNAATRIAIIGAGAGGSSAAFWISKAKERFGLDVEVDIFEKEDYVGGRSITVQPYDDPELVPMELGASIFVKANKNMWRASEEFELARTDFGDEDSVLGIWDGTEFVVTAGGVHFYESWWNTVKVIWRYGFRAPTRTNALVKSMIDKYLTLYTYSFATPFENITQLSESLGWTDVTAQTTSEYFDLQGIDRRWTREMIEAATRVNYGQDADQIHALEGLCSLAATGAAGIKGGNFQVFEQFVIRSNATVYLNTTVRSIKKDTKTSLWTIHSTNASTVMEDIRHYRAVILAAPFHSSSIELSAPSAPVIPVQPYVHLHVTLISTTSPYAKPEYFGLSSGASTPDMVLTTYEGARNGGPEPEFNSLSYHGKVQRKDGKSRDAEEHLVKIFSKKRVEDAWLEKVFGQVGWVYRKEWEAYPVLPPTSVFPPIKLDTGFYYVNAFEPFISTMETETIASRNTVELLLRDVYSASICKTEDTTGDGDRPKTKTEDFIYGWDC